MLMRVVLTGNQIGIIVIKYSGTRFLMKLKKGFHLHLKIIKIDV